MHASRVHRSRSAWSLAGLLLATTLSASCGADDSTGPDEDGFYRQAMRGLVSDLSAWAKSREPGFLVVPQNGQELVTSTGEADGLPQADYLASMDGTGREDLFYGYDGDDQPTPVSETTRMLGLCAICEQYGVEVMAIDYCWTPARVDDSYQRNGDEGFISFAADHRELDDIPSYPPVPWDVHSGDVASLALAENFLYLIDSGAYASRQDFLDAVASTDYDVIVMDLFHEGEPFTASEIAQLRTKAGGGTRLLLCYLSVGEAEDYRYYWQPGWTPGNPAWIEGENPDWPGNYKVRYWDPEWQAILFGSDDSYLGRILDAGFDGAYLDLIDAFEYFE